MNSSNGAPDTTEEIGDENPATPSGMHRPHGVLESIETDFLDELQHEAAHRGSALRTPK